MKAAAAPDVPRVPWREHIAMMDERWQPGQHCSIIAGTGDGKSRLVGKGLWPLWREAPHALILDIKGDDIEVQYGTPVREMPSSRRRAISKMLSVERDYREHFRLVIPRGPQNRAKAREIVREALEQAFLIGDIVVYADELRALTENKSPRLGLAPEFEEIWERGRYRKLTLIAGTQGPRWVPSSFYDQSTYLYIAKFRDKRTRKRLGEIGGDTEQIDAAMMSLKKFEFLFVADRGDTMQIVKHGR